MPESERTVCEKPRMVRLVTGARQCLETNVLIYSVGRGKIAPVWES